MDYIKKRINNHKKPIFVSLIAILILIEVTSIFLAFMSYSNKDLNKIVANTANLDKDMFAIMLEQSDGSYKESSDTAFPSYDYVFNAGKSGCIDSDGNSLPDSLIFNSDNRRAVVSVSNTSYCYLYFDNVVAYPEALTPKLIEDGSMWQSGLEDDGYRFIGSGSATSSTSPDNFICFGTTDLSTCKADESKYLYRIIGVFEDDSGNNHVKLIKYKQLTSSYAWHSDRTVDVSWENSDMYKGLNGSYFLTNLNYDYMQDNTWSDKITNWMWTAVNTKTYSNSGPQYYNGVTTKQIYLHEMNRTNKTSSVGEWTTPAAKIGLVYASDYQMSLGASSLSYVGSTNYTTLKTGWMHQSNNDTTANTYEWTISREGEYGSLWEAWGIHSDGDVHSFYVSHTYGVRPVFYLESNVTYVSGTGDYTDPMIINTDDAKVITTSLTDLTLTATVPQGDYELYKYCLNTSKTSMTDCEWKNASTTISTTLPSSGSYYLHVVDRGGYVIHSGVIKSS